MRPVMVSCGHIKHLRSVGYRVTQQCSTSGKMFGLLKVELGKAAQKINRIPFSPLSVWNLPLCYGVQIRKEKLRQSNFIKSMHLVLKVHLSRYFDNVVKSNHREMEILSLNAKIEYCLNQGQARHLANDH